MKVLLEKEHIWLFLELLCLKCEEYPGLGIEVKNEGYSAEMLDFDPDATEFASGPIWCAPGKRPLTADTINKVSFSPLVSFEDKRFGGGEKFLRNEKESVSLYNNGFKIN